MKKIFALIAAALLLLALSACTDEVEVVAEETPALEPFVTAVPAETPVAETPVAETPAAADAGADSSAQIEALNLLLTDITDSVRPGSSGCSLRAARCAAGLLDWAASCSMSAEQTTAAVQEWMAAQEQDRLALFTESLSFVGDTLTELRGDNAQDLLASAGVTDSGYPWSDAAYQTAQTVFDAAGL